jgi:DDE superfamily endonuclease
VAVMEDVLEVYHRPYNPVYPQICLDETSKQLVAESRPSVPLRPGRCKRVDPEYRRCGVSSVFMLSEPLAGKRHVRVRSQRTKLDFAEVIRELCDELYSEADKIVLVMDNLNTHTTASLYEAFEPAMARRLAEKLEIHYTPLHGSWLNMAEIELSVLSRQCMSDYFENAEQLTKRTADWEYKRNDEKTSIDWRFTTADARIKLRKLYPSI